MIEIERLSQEIITAFKVGKKFHVELENEKNVDIYQIVWNYEEKERETWLHYGDVEFLRVNISNPGKCREKIRTQGKLLSGMILDTLVHGNRIVLCKLLKGFG